jgi:hypothetical protein
MANIVVDDISTQFTFGVTGSNWSEVPASHFYGGSATFAAYAQDGVGGFVGYVAFSFVFQGTSRSLCRDPMKCMKDTKPYTDFRSIMW